MILSPDLWFVATFSDDEVGDRPVSLGGGTGRIGERGFSAGGIGVSISPRQKTAVGIAIDVPDPPSAGAVEDAGR